MKEIIGDLLQMSGIVCIPTNNVVKKDGTLTMGKGLAKDFADKYPDLPRIFGDLIKVNGSEGIQVAIPTGGDKIFVAFPTKEHWRDKSTLERIVRSAISLRNTADQNNWPGPIYLSRVGCGNGGLRWEDVKPVLEQYLDDRFVVVYPGDRKVLERLAQQVGTTQQTKEEIPGYLVNRTIKKGCSDILTCMVTGHRPQNLGGWNFNDAKNLAIMEYVRKIVFKLYAENGTRIFINGTAAGGDLLFALAVLNLKAQYPDAQLWNFIPYPCQKDRFKYQWKQIYDASIAAGSENIVCSSDPVGTSDDARRKDAAKKLFFRNEKMVEVLSPTGMIIAIYSGLPAGLYTIQQVAEMLASDARGGTAHTLLTAVKRHRADKNFCPQVFVINPGNF